MAPTLKLTYETGETVEFPLSNGQTIQIANVAAPGQGATVAAAFATDGLSSVEIADDAPAEAAPTVQAGLDPDKTQA